MATCDTATLIAAACENKFACLDQRPLRFTKLQLLCEWIDSGVAPAAPVATAGSGNSPGAFNANWNTSSGAITYRIDVSTDPGFGSFVTGFNNLNVGNVTTVALTGLLAAQIYYYRIRAVNGFGTSPNSNTITHTTNPISAPMMDFSSGDPGARNVDAPDVLAPLLCPDSPTNDNWEVYMSITGTGFPDTSPADWTLQDPLLYWSTCIVVESHPSWPPGTWFSARLRSNGVWSGFSKEATIS